MSYKFDGELDVINVLPHGNSKSKAPYIRTFKSTKISIQKELKGQKYVQRAMHNVTNNVGGLINVSSSCSLPKHSNQANYIRVKNKKSVALHNTKNEELQRKQSILFIDITFQLGPFYLLLTAYQNTILFVKATEECSTMIGPLMLCMLKDECTYLTRFQKMTAHMPSLKGYLQGYASDHEKLLRNALDHEYPAAVSYNCVVHAKRNISQKCNELGLSKALSLEIIKDIFGQGGLLYCKKKRVK